MKEIICGPKVGPAEPACINNPISGVSITEKETIKRVNLEHCARILSKNEQRHVPGGFSHDMADCYLEKERK